MPTKKLSLYLNIQILKATIMTTLQILEDFEDAINYLSELDMFDGLWTIGESDTILIDDKETAFDIMQELDYCGYEIQEI